MKISFCSLALAVACSNAGGAGSVQLSVAFAQGGAPAAVATVTADVLDQARQAAAPSMGFSLDRTGPRWGGFLSRVPAGKRIVFVQAIGADGARLFHGEAAAEVRADRTILVLVVLDPDQGAQPRGPLIDSLTASATGVDFRETVSLAAVVGDPAASLFSWSASAGNMVGPIDALTAVWQAPPGPRPVVATLTFKVTDAQGASAVLTLAIGVHVSPGNAQVTAEVNNWPRIDTIGASETVAPVGGLAALRASAHDPDGDPLDYSWSSLDCPGTFLSPADRAATIFQLGQLPLAQSCTLGLTVKDGRGGSSRSTLALASGPPGALALPLIDRAIASEDSVFAGNSVALAVVAHDPQGAPLSFTWAEHNGSFDAVASGAGASTAVFRSAPCSGDAWATVSVKNGAGVDYRFDVSNCAPSCKELKLRTPALRDGVYVIRQGVSVYCDMTTDGGGWTLVSHYDAATTRARVFDEAIGQYQAARASDTTYSLGILPQLHDTEMMIVIGQQLLFFNYPADHPDFNYGPGPCISNRPFAYRKGLNAAYIDSPYWGCTSASWGPRDSADESFLVQFGGPGVYSGFDQAWGHDAFIYVR